MLAYFIQGEVFKETPVLDVFYIQPSVDGTKRKQRVLCSIELNRPDTRFLGVLSVIGRSCLDPSSINIKIGKAVVGEDIATSPFKQRWGNRVLANFRESQPGGDTCCTRQSDEQHRLLDAVALFARENMTCLEVFRRRSW